MGRKARFTEQDFIRAAMEVISAKGPGSITMAAIAARAGAPIGSVYHRFKSREMLLAELWVYLIESFQNGFIKLLKSGEGEKAALYILKWARQHPNKAHVLMLYRREQLIKGKWPKDIKKRVEKLIVDMNESVTAFTRLKLGEASKQNLARVHFCLVLAPIGTVKDALETGSSPSPIYDQLILETYKNVLKPHLIKTDAVETGGKLKKRG